MRSAPPKGAMPISKVKILKPTIAEDRTRAFPR